MVEMQFTHPSSKIDQMKLMPSMNARVAPVTSLDAARAAIVSAERFDAGRFAASDLADARQRLALADAAVREQRMEQPAGVTSHC